MAENEKKPADLTSIITTAIQIPGVKISRDDFLKEQFKNESLETVALIVEQGPIAAGCDREVLKRKAARIVKERTAVSTGASFLAGIPGGFAMAATIPADMLQFYAVALRMAQELIYLYGEEDLWCEGTPDGEKVTNQLILYCGVMLGATGAAQTVRIMSSALAKQLLKKLPQMALTKTVIYSVTKAVLKFFGVSITKNTFAKGVSKAVPVAGGIVSGGITLASMLPMGNRLIKTLDTAHFDYTQADFEEDIRIVQEISEQEDEKEEKKKPQPLKNLLSKVKKQPETQKDTMTKLKEAKDLLDAGVLTEEEFTEIKAKLIAEL